MGHNVNNAKRQDVLKLLKTHYREKWRQLPQLAFCNTILPEQKIPNLQDEDSEEE